MQIHAILMQLALAKICLIQISKFVRPGKTGYGQEFSVQILNMDITFFIFLLSESKFSVVRIVRFGKKSGIGHQFLVRILTLSDLSDPNLTQTRIFSNA